MPPDPDLADRRAKIAPVLESLRKLSDKELVAKAQPFATTQRDLAVAIGYHPASLSRAMGSDAKIRRPLSLPIRERLAVFAALQGKDVPSFPSLPARKPYDASQDHASFRLTRPERRRFEALASARLGGLDGGVAVREALATYLTSARVAGHPPPIHWPTSTVRVPAKIPPVLLREIEDLDAEPIVRARHVRAAVLAWMDKHPAKIDGVA